MRGLLGDLIAGGFAAGGKGVGVGLVAYSVFKLFEFICTFLAGRSDARQARVEKLDEKLSLSLAKRLDHLERAEESNLIEIGRLRRAVELLATELRNRGGADDKLQEVANLLSRPFRPDPDTPDDMTDTLGRIQ